MFNLYCLGPQVFHQLIIKSTICQVLHYTRMCEYYSLRSLYCNKMQHLRFMHLHKTIKTYSVQILGTLCWWNFIYNIIFNSRYSLREILQSQNTPRGYNWKIYHENNGRKKTYVSVLDSCHFYLPSTHSPSGTSNLILVWIKSSFLTLNTGILGRVSA